MGGNAPSRSRSLVLYDNDRGREAMEHVKSDFVYPDSLVAHLLPGDMIQVKGNYFLQWFYSHFAIYIGNGEIVHLTDSPDTSSKCQIKRELMVNAFCGRLVRKNNHLDDKDLFQHLIRSPREIVITARDWVGQYWDYDFFFNNCEHWVTTCRYGRPISLQSGGIADIVSGNVSFGEYLACSLYSIAEKASTLFGWVKRKFLVDSIAWNFNYPALQG